MGVRRFISSTPPPNGTTPGITMGRKENTALIVVGLLLVLAHGCAAQDLNDPRTVGLGSSLLPSSSYLNSYGSGGGYNQIYPPYSYSDASNGYGYYSNYQPGGYARQMTNSVAPVPAGCQSGLLNSAQPPSSGSERSGQPPSQIQQASRSLNELQGDGQTRANNQMPSDPKAGQTISTQTSNVQQSIVQQAPIPIHRRPLIYGDSFHYPYGLRAFSQPQSVPAHPVTQPDQFQHMRAVDNMNSMAFFDDNANQFRTVPSELHFVDPSQFAGRQTLPVQGRPTVELTYNPQDMVNTYGPANYQPPIFSLWKRQNPAFRGLQSGYQFAYPPIDTRYFGGGVQQIQQGRIEHPLQVLRQVTPPDHTNQPLPPNLYRTGKWEPVTNLNIQTPVNLVELDNAGYPIQGATGYAMQGARSSASAPSCRDKRQMDSSWMYPLAGWSTYDSRLDQQRSASPLTPYHSPFAPMNEIFPPGQQFTGPAAPSYIPGFTNPHAKGAVEGIQNFVSGIAQMVPMFTGGTPVYR